MNKPLISVIVPIYNVENYLNKCIDSIFCQSYKNMEIILVDDGSTDNSGAIADSYSSNKMVKIIHKKNGGLSDARNVGIAASSGQWISFVDSDDYLDKDFLNRLYTLASKSDSDIATCGFIPFTDDESTLKNTINWTEGVLSGDEAVADMLERKRPAYICLSLYKKKLFTDNNIVFPTGREYEDIATRVKLLLSANNVCFTNDRLYYYLIRKSSITGKPFSKKRYDDYVFAINEVVNTLKAAPKFNKYAYVKYFEFYSYVTLLNYLARCKTLRTNDERYWNVIADKIHYLYRSVVFPGLKEKIIYGMANYLSYNKKLYGYFYRSLK